MAATAPPIPGERRGWGGKAAGPEPARAAIAWGGPVQAPGLGLPRAPRPAKQICFTLCPAISACQALIFGYCFRGPDFWGTIGCWRCTGWRRGLTAARCYPVREGRATAQRTSPAKSLLPLRTTAGHLKGFCGKIKRVNTEVCLTAGEENERWRIPLKAFLQGMGAMAAGGHISSALSFYFLQQPTESLPATASAPISSLLSACRLFTSRAFVGLFVWHNDRTQI